MSRKLCYCGWEYDYEGDHEAYTKAFNEHFDSQQHQSARVKEGLPPGSEFGTDLTMIEWQVDAQMPPAEVGQLVRFDHVEGPIFARVVDVSKTETGYLVRLALTLAVAGLLLHFFRGSRHRRARGVVLYDVASHRRIANETASLLRAILGGARFVHYVPDLRISEHLSRDGRIAKCSASGFYRGDACLAPDERL